MDTQSNLWTCHDKAKGPKRHTHSTIAGLEDLTAVLVDLHLAIERLQTFLAALKVEAEAIDERIDTATDIVNIVRVGPDTYPTERETRRTKTSKPKRGLRA